MDMLSRDGLVRDAQRALWLGRTAEQVWDEIVAYLVGCGWAACAAGLEADVVLAAAKKGLDQ
jgi:hypothetical protein